MSEQSDTIKAIANFDNWPFDYLAAIQPLLPNYVGCILPKSEAEYNSMIWEDLRTKPSWQTLQESFLRYKQQLRCKLYHSLELFIYAEKTLKFKDFTYDVSDSTLLTINSICTWLNIDKTIESVNWFNEEQGPCSLSRDDFLELFKQAMQDRNQTRSTF
jgi:hypothetical protein